MPGYYRRWGRRPGLAKQARHATVLAKRRLLWRLSATRATTTASTACRRRGRCLAARRSLGRLLVIRTGAAQDVEHRVVAFVAGVLGHRVIVIQLERQPNRPRARPRLRIIEGHVPDEQRR